MTPPNLLKWNKKQDNSLFFEPVRQQGNENAIDPHRTSTLNLAHGPVTIGIPKGCNVVLAQAVNQNINYTLSGTNPTATSGFVLIAGNDPLAIPCRLTTAVITFHAAADGARLELQFGQV